ncbi:hypothetical protein BaRGS_00029119, partial [Batillaria attramentaria]
LRSSLSQIKIHLVQGLALVQFLYVGKGAGSEVEPKKVNTKPGCHYSYVENVVTTTSYIYQDSQQQGRRKE